jgi:hypothetical protein
LTIKQPSLSASPEAVVVVVVVVVGDDGFIDT